MITYTTFRPGDEAHIVSLWNECLEQDSITGRRFRNLILLDANFDPDGLFLAKDGERLVGCVYAVRRQLPMHGTDLEPDNGWIPVFFVSPQYRRQRIGQTLLERALDFFGQHGRKHVYFASYTPNYILPGLDADAYPAGYHFLQSCGFETLYSPVAMHRSLLGFTVPEKVRERKKARIEEGYVFRSVADGDLYDLIRFANQSFNPDWGRAIREGLLQGLSQERMMIACQGETIVGFAVYGAYEGIGERFGPFGVDENQRGKGLGKIILYDTLTRMAQEGLHGAWFLWTGENSPAGYLYKQAGFDVTRKFHVMLKRL